MIANFIMHAYVAIFTHGKYSLNYRKTVKLLNTCIASYVRSYAYVFIYGY